MVNIGVHLAPGNANRAPSVFKINFTHVLSLGFCYPTAHNGLLTDFLLVDQIAERYESSLSTTVRVAKVIKTLTVTFDGFNV